MRGDKSYQLKAGELNLEKESTDVNVIVDNAYKQMTPVPVSSIVETRQPPSSPPATSWFKGLFKWKK